MGIIKTQIEQHPHGARIYDERPDHDSAFAVGFVKALPFPDARPVLEDVEQLALCGATDEDGVWSWVHWETGQKDVAGSAMMDHGCVVGKWYWCILFDKEAEATA